MTSRNKNTHASRPRDGHNANVALMEKCGSQKGYDPMPPDTYLCFLDPEFELSKHENRLLAWLRSKTIRARKGGRSHYARDHRGELGLSHAAGDLGIALSNLSKAMNGLEEKGLAQRDEAKPGRLLLWARPEYDPRRKSEDSGDGDGKESCTNNLPQYLRVYFQSLDEKQRAQCLHGYKLVQDYAKKIEADAIAAARTKAREVETAYLKSIGFEEEEPRGRPKGPQDKSEPRLVQLHIEEPPPDFVQISAAQISAGNSDGIKTPSAHKTGSLLLSKTVREVSKSETPQPLEEPASEPYLPTSESEFPPAIEPEADPAVVAVEQYFGPFEPESPKREEAAGLAAEFGIPPACVALAMHAKMEEKQDVGYTVSSAGALIAFVRSGLPGWIRQHPRELEAHRKYQSSPPARAGREPAEQDGRTSEEVQAEIDRLRKELRGEHE